MYPSRKAVQQAGSSLSYLLFPLMYRRAGQYNKLVQRVRRGNLDVVWNMEDSSERLQEVCGGLRF